MFQLAAPESVGMSAARMQSAFQILQNWLDEGTITAVTSVVMRRGQLVGAFYGGAVAPSPAAVPVGQENLFHLASIGKPMTALAVMLLVEAGKISLEDPVATILPEFAGTGRDEITVRQLLSHTSGMPQDPDLSQVPAGSATAEELPTYLKALPIVPPGSKVEYSNVGYGLLGLIIETVSGQSFPAYMHEHIFKQIGMEHAYLAPPEAIHHRIVHVGGTFNPDSPYERYNSPYARSQTHPAGMVMGTAIDVARFLQLFLDHGQANGQQVIAPATARLMTTNQTSGLRGGIEGFMTWENCSWGLGFDLRGNKQPHFAGEFSSPATFGHTGVAGTFAWADPANDLICVMLANRMLYNRWNTPRWSRFSTAVVAAVID